MASAPHIAVTASSPAMLRENARIPKRPLTRAPIPGRSGMSQMYSMFSRGGLDGSAGSDRSGKSYCSSRLPTCLTCPTCLPAVVLPPHQVHLINVHGLFVPVERQDDAQADGRFRGGHRDDEDREHLAR